MPGSDKIIELGDFSRHEANFAEFRAKNPGATFRHYCSQRVMKNIEAGKPHATLGDNLRKSDDFWDAGRGFTKGLVRMLGIEPHHRVVDYGCGTLRLGAHLMQYLKPENYTGLELEQSYLDMGKELVGDAILTKAQPVLATINDETLEAAGKFGADFVFSCAVADNVHPDETDEYFGNLKRLAGKSSTVICFDATLTQDYLRPKFRAWTRPLGFYREAMQPFEYRSLERKIEKDIKGRTADYGYLIFRRDA